MPYRQTPLLTGKARCTLIVPRAVVTTTQAALMASSGPDGPHEGLVLWAGIRVDTLAFVIAPVLVESDHGPRHVIADERGFGRAVRTVRAYGLQLVAQVHSHPGDITIHSDGDDGLILAPYEGYFSLVVGNYGRGGFAEGLGVHEYQSGKWVYVGQDSPDSVRLVPEALAGGVR